MASASFSLANTGDSIYTLSNGAQTITEATSAPGAGDLEVRIDLTKGWTKASIERALDTIWRFIEDPGRSTSIPL